MLPSTRKRITANPVGRVLFGAVRPLLHIKRRLANPGLPDNLALETLTCCGRDLSVVIRRWDPSNHLALQQCFRDLQYELPPGPHATAVDLLYKEIVASGRQPLILDCGANIGASVLWFLARYPAAHVVAVEPSSENFKLLELNCAALDVDLRHAAIGPADGRSVLINPDQSAMTYRVDPDGDGEAVDLVSVPTLLAGKPDTRFVPFLLKVDIEGGEQSLFTGDPTALRRFPLIILEPHDWMLPGQHPSLEFFRFHVEAGREFAMKEENVLSLDLRRPASQPTLAH